MNAFMNIQVRIITNQAQQRIRQLEREMANLDRGLTRTGRTGARDMERGFGRMMTSGTKFGNQLQWTGRQLQYNFAMPLALAAGMATKFWMDNERAMVRVRKVYGDAGQTAEDFGGEVKALERNFKALSNHFGVHRAEVIKVAGDWAAVGATGVALAKAVRLTIETAVLGEMDLAEATTALISVQGQYNLSISELSKSMDTLNMIENETDTSMKDLITSMTRSAGTARNAGVSIQELAAMTAALVPEVGTASTAGNGLKTMISRLLAPTEDAAALLGKMGMNMNDVGWQSQTVTQRLQTLADAFVELPEGQRAVVAEYAAGRWQITRFNQLLTDVADKLNGDYHKAMRASADDAQNFKQRQRELNAVLESAPQKMKQVGIVLQNSMADVIQPLIPAIVYFAQQLAHLGNMFANLDPRIQAVVGSAALFLILFGPLVRYMGSSLTLITTMGNGLHFLAYKFAGAAAMGARFLMMPWSKGVAGVMLLVKAVGLIPLAFMGAGRTILKMTFMARAMQIIQAHVIIGMAAIKGWWIAGWVAMKTFFVTTFLNPIKVLWAGFLLQMRTLWASTLVIMRSPMNQFIGVMTGLWSAMWGGMVSIAAAGRAAIVATWGLMFGPMAKSFGFFRTQISMIWTMLTFGLQAAWLGMTAALQGIWLAFTRAWVLMTAQGATAIQKIWLMMVGMARIAGTGIALAFIAPIRGLGTAALALGPKLVAGFRALPGAVARLVPIVYKAFIRLFPMIFRFLTGWVGLALTALLGVAYAFRNQIAEAFRGVVDIFSAMTGGIATAFTPLTDFFGRAIQWVVDAFWTLPKGVRDAFLAVVSIVKQAALAVYEWFSYLNPWARHSPSLVESVNTGADAVIAAYARMGTVGAQFQKAVTDLAAFKRAAASLGIDEWSDKRMEIAEGLPQMLPLFNTLVKDLKGLNSVLAQQKSAAAAQEAVVKRWKTQLDAANLAVDLQRNKLDGLKDTLETLTNAYDAHQAAMQSYASAPIKGMGAMSDKIFENEIAQKKLRLEIMNWEDANGSVDSLRDRLGMLQGDIESARSEAADLRGAGAGSDVLGPIEAEIAAMEAQAKAAQTAISASPVDNMRKELEALERQGERLDLENAITFDPMVREIEKLVNAQQELSYDQIIAGVNRERAAMDALEPSIEKATAAVVAQEAAVKAAEAARDSIQNSYDIEDAKLQVLNDRYRETEDLIRDIEGALNDVAGAARAAVAAKNRLNSGDERYALEKFDAAAAADFADQGGSGNVPREFPEIADQSAMIDELTAGLAADTAKLMGEFDLLGPIKDAYYKARDWVMATPIMEFLFGKKNVSGDTPTEGLANAIWNDLNPIERIRLKFPFLDDMLKSVSDFREKVPGYFKEAGAKIGEAWDWVYDTILAPVGRVFKDLWDLFQPDIKRIWEGIRDFVMDIWTEFAPEVAKWGDLFKPLMDAVVNIFQFLWPYVQIALGILLGIIKVAFSTIGHIIGPILDTIVGVVTNVFQTIRGVIQIILGLINGDWSLFGAGLYNLVSGTFGAIWALIEGIGRTVVGIVRGIVEGIFGFFKWLYDKLVGHSVIPDLVDAIWRLFKGLAKIGQWIWDNAIKPVLKFFVDMATAVGATLLTFVQMPFITLKALWKLGQWVWDNVLKPVVSIFANLWSGNIKGALESLIRLINNVFNGLNGLPMAIWNNVLKPIIDKFGALWGTYIRPVLNTLIRGIGHVFNAVGDGIAAGVNVGIKAINKLVEAINWVGKNVPGLNFSIGTIGTFTPSKWTPPQFATGGKLPSSAVGEGFVANRARAIVGEGRGNHPEYVVPTDPQHRRNALKLYGQLGNDLGAPMGGWGFDVPNINLGAVRDAATNAVKGAATAVRRGMVTAALAAPLKAFDAINSLTPNRPAPLRDMLSKMKNDVYNWAKGMDGQLPTEPPPGVVGNAALPGSGWTAIENFLKNTGNVNRAITSTLRPGDPGYHGRNLAVDYSIGGHGNKGYQAPGLRAIFDALLPAAGNLAELILAGAPFNIKNGKKVAGYAWGQPGQPGNHWNHVHAAAMRTSTRIGGVQELARGGILNSTVFAAGEAGREIVSPLAPLWGRFDVLERKIEAQQDRSRGGDTIININGNLEFPNISSGDDAEAFIRNLEIVARQ